jgi:hypothetical protein
MSMIRWRIRRWWTESRPVIVRRKTLRLLAEAVHRADQADIAADRLRIELHRVNQNAITPRQAAKLRRKLKEQS